MSDSQATHKQINISSDHPSLAGHFPGNPVVPGVVILDYVRQCIEQWKHFSVETSNLKSVKFLSPLLMNEKSMSDVSSRSLELVLVDKKSNSRSQAIKIEFRCLQGDDLIVQGQWLIEADRSQ